MSGGTMTCPFCGENGFDTVGLKSHLLNWCEDFENTESSDLPRDQLRETLLHELFHACIGIGNGGDRSFSTDDAFIEATAPTMLLILRDNPKLLKWLTESSR